MHLVIIVSFVVAFLGACLIFKKRAKYVDLSTCLPEGPIEFCELDPLMTLPQLNDQYKKKGIEYWYFDFEDPSSSCKLVVIFKRCDGAGLDGGGVHLEITTHDGKDKKFYLRTKESEFRSERNDDWCFIHIDSKNWFKISDSGQFYVNIDVGAAMAIAKGQSQCPGFLLNKYGNYFFSKSSLYSRSGAAITMPYFKGNVYMRTSRNETLYSFDCNGYHDHPFATDHFLKTHYQWNWMRFCHDDIYIMYAQVKPNPNFYGNCKYLYVWKRGMEKPLFDTEFQIEELEYKRGISLIRYASKISVESKALNLVVDLEHSRAHSDQIIFNRSEFHVRATLGDDDTVYSGKALVEYFKMPTFLTTIARWLICILYVKWERNANK